jgi:hypothetical protein
MHWRGFFRPTFDGKCGCMNVNRDTHKIISFYQGFRGTNRVNRATRLLLAFFEA